MKQAVLLVILGSLLSCFAQQQTLLPVPDGYWSTHSFHYGGQIYAVLDVANTSSLNPKLAVLSNGKWGQIIDLPQACDAAPCFSHTDDVLVQHNIAYITGGDSSYTKHIFAVDLQAMAVVGQTLTPNEIHVEAAFMLPAQDGFAYYFYLQDFHDDPWTAKFDLSSLQFVDLDLAFDFYYHDVIVPLDENTLYACGHGYCISIDTTSNGEEIFLAPFDHCINPNYLATSSLLTCTLYTSNETVISSFSLTETSITANQTVTLPGDNYPIFSAINALTNTGYIVVSLSDNSDVLYEIDLVAFEEKQHFALNTGSSYAIVAPSKILPDEGDGLLVLPVIGLNGTLPLSQYLLITV